MLGIKIIVFTVVFCHIFGPSYCIRCFVGNSLESEFTLDQEIKECPTDLGYCIRLEANATLPKFQGRLSCSDKSVTFVATYLSTYAI